VALEENNCFDGEVYADEIDIPEKLDFREDQRSESLSRLFVMYELAVTFLFSQLGEMGVAEFIRCVPRRRDQARRDLSQKSPESHQFRWDAATECASIHCFAYLTIIALEQVFRNTLNGDASTAKWARTHDAKLVNWGSDTKCHCQQPPFSCGRPFNSHG
jgi:hypothetical protein